MILHFYNLQFLEILCDFLLSNVFDHLIALLDFLPF